MRKSSRNALQVAIANHACSNPNDGLNWNRGIRLCAVVALKTPKTEIAMDNQSVFALVDENVAWNSDRRSGGKLNGFTSL